MIEKNRSPDPLRDEKQGTRVFRRRERYVSLILGIVRAYAASTVGNTGRRGDFGSWEVEG